MRLRNTWVGLLGITMAASIVACGGGSSETSNKSGDASAPSATPAGQRVDTATAGTLKGVVTLDGTAPKNEAIKMNADPVCVRENKTPQFQETYQVGSDGKSLANVFVYVKDGLGNYTYDVPGDPIVLEQKGCRYIPHVFGLQIGQKLQVVNDDPTLHNIHASPMQNAEFNFG